MATFSYTTPKNLSENSLAVQANATKTLSPFTRTVTTQGTMTFDATTEVSSISYVTGTKFDVVSPEELAEVKLRPQTGLVYPRNI